MNENPLFKAVVGALAEKYDEAPNFVERLLKQKLSGISGANDIALALEDVKRHIEERRSTRLTRAVATILGESFEFTEACLTTPGVDVAQILVDGFVKRVIAPHILPEQ